MFLKCICKCFNFCVLFLDVIFNYLIFWIVFGGEFVICLFYLFIKYILFLFLYVLKYLLVILSNGEGNLCKYLYFVCIMIWF